MADIRHPAARARDAWMQSIEGRRCVEGHATGQYLRNRIELAFLAGWNARDAQNKSARRRPGAKEPTDERDQ